MNIDELVRKGLLKKVNVKGPPNSVIEAGNRKSKVLYQNLMSARTCSGNSICVVDAMLENGESDWHIVLGFAFPPNQKNPAAHVWVRKASHHYDPTWVLWKWRPEDLAYYRVLQHLEIGPRERDTLSRLQDLASKWELKLLE